MVRIFQDFFVRSNEKRKGKKGLTVVSLQREVPILGDTMLDLAGRGLIPLTSYRDIESRKEADCIFQINVN